MVGTIEGADDGATVELRLGDTLGEAIGTVVGFAVGTTEEKSKLKNTISLKTVMLF